LSQRLQKVQSLARTILGETIQSLKDPRIGFVTVTAVRFTGDLRHARVLVSVLGDEDAKSETMSGLGSARAFLRSELGRQMRLKYLPELVFELDRATDVAERVEALLREAADQGSETRDQG
jgi:ribosome-binding factor A